MTQEINQDCALIALDWGTSSLRCYRFDHQGQVVERRAHPWGIMNLPAVAHGDDAQAPYRAALEAACGDWLKSAPNAPLIAAGMVGSKQGWREAAYLSVPLAPERIGRKLTEVDTGLGRPLWIIPGLLQNAALPNVMRGEETQVIGALQTRTDRELLIGLPGTHSKWVRVVEGSIEHFDTFMTGEVYGALCAHTILGRTMHKPEVADDAAFLRGARVAQGPDGQRGVLSNIFSSRTLGLTGELSAEAQPDYLSGLLIGHELAALKALYPNQPPAIVLIGDPGLCRRYRLALELFGLGPVSEATDATETGLWVLARHAALVA